MKRTVNVETTIVVDLSAQDIDEDITKNNLVSSDWKYYSTEIIGNGVSNGARLIVKHLAMDSAANR